MLPQASRAARFGNGFADDGDSGWSDEILWASPLDQFDAYARFSSLLAGASELSLSRALPGSDGRISAGLQSQNATLYQSSLSGLSAEQQTVLADVASKAAEGGDAVVAERAFAAMQAEEEEPLRA